jgi:hypothetical protein
MCLDAREAGLLELFERGGTAYGANYEVLQWILRRPQNGNPLVTRAPAKLSGRRGVAEQAL